MRDLVVSVRSRASSNWVTRLGVWVGEEMEKAGEEEGDRQGSFVISESGRRFHPGNRA